MTDTAERTADTTDTAERLTAPADDTLERMTQQVTRQDEGMTQRPRPIGRQAFTSSQ